MASGGLRSKSGLHQFVRNFAAVSIPLRSHLVSKQHHKMGVEKPNAEQASPSPSTLERIFPMAKGDGEESYSKNSQYQAFVNKGPMSILDEALEKVALPSGGGPVRVADLGSSSGPNTIVTVDRIVGKLQRRLPKDTEFQAHFNDVASNDFNNLFQLLSSDSRSKDFFAAGVPGSFFDRLFPQSSMHVIHSSFSLHWLSKIPEEVLDQESPAYNRGMIWYQHSRSAVARSYQQQASLDLQRFLQARAAELVSGGLLFLSFNGRETSEPNEVDGDLVCNIQSDLHEILTGLVAEGLVTEQQYDTFNCPLYHRSSEDIREALKCCGSMFNLHILKPHKADISDAFAAFDATARPKKVIGTYKAIMNPQVEAHFGTNVTDVIWQRYEKLIELNIAKRTDPLTQWIVALIRN